MHFLKPEACVPGKTAQWIIADQLAYSVAEAIIACPNERTSQNGRVSLLFQAYTAIKEELRCAEGKSILRSQITGR